jgi:uncharacterized membrane-anchored protein YhcB (DUF1043 family)
MEIVLFVNWLCVEAQSCQPEGDISNVFSTIVGTVLGILIGAFISWLVYNRQEKTTKKQEHILQKIQEYEQKHDKILKNILRLDEKIDSLLENKSH